MNSRKLENHLNILPCMNGDSVKAYSYRSFGLLVVIDIARHLHSWFCNAIPGSCSEENSTIAICS